MTPPPHHTASGFRNPWPRAAPHGFRDFLRWTAERWRTGRPADPEPGVFPVAQPSFGERGAPGALAATWVGHSTVLLQLGRANVLTDPMWSERASPVSFAGPKRFVLPAVDLDALPPLDVILLSHNHYDHLDAPTVERLAARAPAVPWVAPLGLGDFLRDHGVREVRELDWWEEATMAAGGTTIRVACTPAQHFSGRGLHDRDRALWCGFAIAADGLDVLFAGDTGLHHEWRLIAERYGPFDLVLLPVGAYAPRWFMGPVHMDPDDAIAAYRDLTARQPADRPCAMLPIHWGTFRLTDEAMTEPPERTRAAWRVAGCDERMLWLLEHGETRRTGARG